MKNNKGFTLIELLVVVAIFVYVPAVAPTGACVILGANSPANIPVTVFLGPLKYEYF